MKIRIQPRLVEIPECDPFKYDLLDRRDQVEVLTNVLGAIEGPCTLTIDAPWGAGKTTFINIWSQYLRNKGFPVVSFNAWETDFSDDPFIALSEELSKGLKEFKKPGFGDQFERFKGASLEIARRAIPGLIRVGTAGIADVNPLIEQEAGQLLSSIAQERISAYSASNETVNEFRESLEELAESLSEDRDGMPLVVVIDELDRCRPSYAVQLPEIANHLFVVDHVIYVLAVNRSELAHSVSALYGSNFDAIGYLGRFFDIDLRLADPDRQRFMDATLDALQVNDFFSRTKDREAQSNQAEIREMLKLFFGSPSLSIRTIGKSLHRLGLLLASMRSDRRLFVFGAVVSLIVRTIDVNLYQKLIRGDVVDESLVDEIFSKVGSLAKRYGNAACGFEAAIIVGLWETTIRGNNFEAEIDSPLMDRYEQELNKPRPDGDAPNERYRYAQEVVRIVRFFAKSDFANRGGNQIGFEHCAQRLELLSRDLVEDDLANN